MLPGALVMLGLSLLYALGRGYTADRRRLIWHQGGCAGHRRRGADPHRQARAQDIAAARIAGAAFVGIFFLALPFPFIVIAAALIGLWPRVVPGLARASAVTKLNTWRHPRTTAGGRLRSPRSSASLPGGRRSRWPRYSASKHVLVSIGLFFSKLAVVSFGGAYALLAYMAQEAVETHGWMTAPEMVDGLGLAETTPGPLILVTQFVGFLAGFRDAAPFSPVTAGILAAAMTTWVTFVPSMLWIFAGAPFVEQLRANRQLSGALAAITAAVVGVILNLTVWFALHVLFGKVTEQHAGPLRWYAFDPLALDLRATAWLHRGRAGFRPAPQSDRGGGRDGRAGRSHALVLGA